MTRHENAGDLLEFAARDRLFHAGQRLMIEARGAYVTGRPAIGAGFRSEIVVRFCSLRDGWYEQQTKGEKDGSSVPEHGDMDHDEEIRYCTGRSSPLQIG